MGTKSVTGFHGSAVSGDYGEYKVKKLFAEHFGDSIDYAEDKSLNKVYQKAGIDLVVQYYGDTITTIEVKNDLSTNSNIFYETISRAKPGEEDVPGCMLTTQAETLCYVFEELDVVLMLPVKSLREWVDSYLKGGGYLEAKDVTNFTYISRGYLIPIERLMGEHPSWSKVYGMKIVDMKSGGVINYKEFEERRLLVEEINNDETLPPFVTRDEHWEVHNKRLWEDNGVIGVATKSMIDAFKK